MSNQGFITAFRVANSDSRCPYRVLIDGKPDPRNREFKDLKDIKDTFEYLQLHGLYGGYQIVFSDIDFSNR